MQSKLVKRCANMDQSLFAGGHARLEGCRFTVRHGFGGFAYCRVLDEILQKTYGRRRKRHGCRAVTVIGYIKRRELETRDVPFSNLTG